MLVFRLFSMDNKMKRKKYSSPHFHLNVWGILRENLDTKN